MEEKMEAEVQRGEALEDYLVGPEAEGMKEVAVYSLPRAQEEVAMGELQAAEQVGKAVVAGVLVDGVAAGYSLPQVRVEGEAEEKQEGDTADLVVVHPG
ncbi:hypothetical protein AB1Y20_021479 [Prymnesium parvum]|uniref:Uncharacterized protein n=1 Tax=Prymnesium parvum TaxID=97485 RepID=A0AB34JLN5_PRYPA|mmetsp:Transcript_38647/g.67896  ORF Transcript_38647/g.67896 Transcript_38647/m.67896 type:complete len:99 (+) Transcript_38647:102-398(+)